MPAPNHWPTNPRPGAALVTLKQEVLHLRPHLPAAGFGMIGDRAHAARRSDHNPSYYPHLRTWVVRAVDIPLTVGDGNRRFGQRMVQLGRAGRLGRYGYVISDRRIASRKTRWRWVHYDGTDPHTGHVHISFGKSRRVFDNTAPFGLTRRDLGR